MMYPDGFTPAVVGYPWIPRFEVSELIDQRHHSAAKRVKILMIYRDCRVRVIDWSALVELKLHEPSQSERNGLGFLN